MCRIQVPKRRISQVKIIASLESLIGVVRVGKYWKLVFIEMRFITWSFSLKTTKLLTFIEYTQAEIPYKGCFGFFVVQL